MSPAANGDGSRVTVPRIGPHQMQNLGARLTGETEACFSIGIAAVSSGEGATTVAVNLARFLATELSKRVVLVDANLRRPALHGIFGLPRAPGLTDVLRGAATPQSVLHFPDAEPISVVTAGREAEHPAALFSAPAFATFVERLWNAYDFALFDAAPIAAHNDTAALGAGLDRLVVVLQAEQSRYEVARRAINDIRAGDVQFLGAVLNRKPLFIPEFLYRVL